MPEHVFICFAIAAEAPPLAMDGRLARDIGKQNTIDTPNDRCVQALARALGILTIQCYIYIYLYSIELAIDISIARSG